ncbi:ABC transporter permease DevC [bacterium]|nr:ABC transporter permease DevC [bacterium]
MIGNANRVPLTWYMLTHRKSRLLLAMMGIAFAVLLMFMQLGFLTGLFDSQTLGIRLFDADLLMVNRTKHNLTLEEFFLEKRIIQARDVPGVARTTGVSMDSTLWRHPQTGRQDVIRVIGIDPDHPPFLLDEVVAQSSLLHEPMTILFDRGSRSFFGTPVAGNEAELGARRVRVLGTFNLGADFKMDGNVLASQSTYRALFPLSAPDQISVGLIRLKSGESPAKVQQAIRDALPSDIDVFTIDEYDQIERRFWSKMTPTGFIFTLGLIVGFAIGVMICYQILYNEINDHLPQFATLKAIGFSNGYLVGVVLKEAILLAVLGLVPALFASQAFYSIMTQLTGLHMELTLMRIVLVSVLTVVMCVISGLIAVGRVMKADPAEVF